MYCNVTALETKVETLTTNNRTLAGKLKESTESETRRTEELKQAKDQISSLLRQTAELKKKNEELNGNGATNKENQQRK